jgi:5-methylcytosine-specific restriction enzyme A
MEEGVFILRKSVDWSLLVYGFNIPIAIQSLFYNKTGELIPKGVSKKINIIIQGETFEAILTNINFDSEKYQTHKELLQIRYSDKSSISKKLKAIFSESYKFLLSEKQIQSNKRQPIKVPENIKEYIVLSTTQFQDTFLLDCFSQNENFEISKTILTYTEDQFEAKSNFILNDKTASIIEKERLVKVRKVDKSICESLKYIYQYRCQITGEQIGDIYGGNVVEAHHVEYFTKSLNNDSSNIIILSPNFHRIIHKTNPFFDRDSLSFIFENGIKEKLRLNLHL